MADHIQFKVSAVPVEELTDEQGNTKKVISGEVGKILSGGGDSRDLANYLTAAGTQGYLNATVNYIDAVHTSTGTALASTGANFYFLKNTGYKFSDATTLGAATTDCILIVIALPAYSVGLASGWVYVDTTPRTHYLELGWLKPGQAMVLPAGVNALAGTINKTLDGTANNLAHLGETDTTVGTAIIRVKTYQADGNAATDGNALEMLVVT